MIEQLRAAFVAFADRLHAGADVDALAHGLTVQRVGMSGRLYRDPRVSALSPGRRPEKAGADSAPVGDDTVTTDALDQPCSFPLAG